MSLSVKNRDALAHDFIVSVCVVSDIDLPLYGQKDTLAWLAAAKSIEKRDLDSFSYLVSDEMFDSAKARAIEIIEGTLKRRTSAFNVLFVLAMGACALVLLAGWLSARQ